MRSISNLIYLIHSQSVVERIVEYTNEYVNRMFRKRKGEE